MFRIITVLAPGFEEAEAVTFIDLLRRAKVPVTVLGLQSLEVKGSHDITLIADGLLDEFSGPFDGIVLPGGMPGSKNLAESTRVLDLVRDAHKQGALCAAICAAPMVLGKAGILLGVRATCFPGCEEKLVGASIVEQPVVRDRNVITSRGLGAAVVFGLELISYLCGQEEAERIRGSILFGT
jgi:4-methyl-5(b-hydroxyethyl)-thiazole monophosphate biosynthesis